MIETIGYICAFFGGIVGTRWLLGVSKSLREIAASLDELSAIAYRQVQKPPTNRVV